MIDTNAIIQTVLIVIGVSVGILGIHFLSSLQPNQRRVGVVIFPFLPAILFFLIAFNITSQADLGPLGDLVGQFAGPFAGYLAGVWFVRQQFNPSIQTDELAPQVESLKTEKSQLELALQDKEKELAKLHSENQELRSRIANPPSPRLDDGIGLTYTLSDTQKIIIQKGDIAHIEGVDAFVNSENTDMMLARYYDTSLSGTLRYLDAERGPGGHVEIDHLNDALRSELNRLNVTGQVAAGTVFVTPTHGLRKNGVKYIFHAATVVGESRSGYRPIRQLGVCVDQVFEECKKLHDKPDLKSEETITSILFPLFGAGAGGLPPVEAANLILPQIIREMRQYPFITEVHLLAFKQVDLEAWDTALIKAGLTPD